MTRIVNRFEISLEVGKTRTFATALDWPGWCRSGADEASALQTLFEYHLRYARVLAMKGIPFQPPSQLSDLVVVEHLAGNTTTDFGAPNLPLVGDIRPVTAAELQYFQKLLEACWQMFDMAVATAAGKALRKGPRGGGRDLTKIIEHTYEADAAYLRSLGGKPKPETAGGQAMAQLRQDILATLTAAAHGEIPERGPRGGLRWMPRYFVRRIAWHELDHAWEIESRSE